MNTIKCTTGDRQARLLRSILISIIMLLSFQAYAQRIIDTNLAKNAWTVNVEKIIIQGDSMICGLTPNFPYPILTAITVFDSVSNFITGLADTSRWLGPTDLAQIGLPISTIWQPILEYHLENPSIPGDPNLYHQIPEPLFTEVLQDIQIPTSTMLVMDVSTSMTEKLDDAKAGARLYVEQLRPIDRAGIILFNHEVVKLQSFTHDKNLLLATIDSAETDFGTAINDALIAAIQVTKFEQSRPRIIVYTDGRDNHSVHTPTAVVDSANVYNIPIYTIALGDYTIQDTLKQIAERTGGLFFKVDSASQMQDLYLKLSDLIQHFYIMAHTSPDPMRNNTWRMVDVTVNLPERYGNYQMNGTGKYFIEGAPSELSADLAIELSSLTDTTIIRSNDTLNAVSAGDVYSYQIRITNLGPAKANFIRVSHIIPDSVRFINTSIEPLIARDSLFTWQFNNLEVNDKIDIFVLVQLPANISKDVTELISRAELLGDTDYNLENNADEDTVIIFIPKPIPNCDLAISQTARTDSAALFGTDSVQVVMPGDTVNYLLTIENLGKATASNFKVWNVVHDSLGMFDSNPHPTSQNSDTLFWYFDSLSVGNVFNISLSARASDSFPNNLFPLDNVCGVVASKDTFQQNNIALTTIYGILPPVIVPLNYDLSMSQSVITDTIVVIENDSIPTVFKGHSMNYTLTVENLGPKTAHNFTVLDQLPDSVNTLDFSLYPTKQQADTLFWQFDSLSAGDKISFSFQTKVADSLPEKIFPLINVSQVIAEKDTFEQNNFATTTVYAISKSDSIPLTEVDLAVTQVAMTDSFSVVDADTIHFARRGENYSYTITVLNHGLGTAQSIRVINYLPDSVNVKNFQPSPSIISTDSLVWNIGQLELLSSVRLKFDATVPLNMPIGKNLLINKVTVNAVNENPTYLADNTSIDTVYNIVKPGGDLLPQIEAIPAIVEVGGQVSVRVQVPFPIESWDIWVYLADGSVDDDFANRYIENTKLDPHHWYDVDQKYSNIKLFTSAEQEQMIFELRTTDMFGDLRTAQAMVTVMSNNDFYLDRNVFEAQKPEPLGINFKLSTNRSACLDLFDITGRKITNLTEGPYQAGWNAFHWNGTLENDQIIGSGLYFISLKSGNFNALRKVMIVQ